MDQPRGGRRRFLAASGALLAVSSRPRIAAAAEPKRVGIYHAGVFDGQHEAAVGRELARHGLRVGRDVELVSRWTSIRPEEASRGARELVSARVDVILTAGTPFTEHARSATRSIPIVTDVADPVAAGFAESLRRPGGSVTGLTQGQPELFAKRLEVLREMIPGLAHVAWIAFSPQLVWFPVFERTAVAAGLGVRRALLDGLTDAPARFEAQLAEARAAGCRAAYFYSQVPDAFKIVAAIALKHGVVLCTGDRTQLAADGFLVSYEFVRTEDESLRSKVAIAARILKGEKPGDIPFEGPTRFHLGLNRRTAARFGLAVPTSLLVRANEVIG